MNFQMGLLAKKLGMTEVFEQDGTRVPVTVLACAGNIVISHRTEERDGYSALQLAFDEQKPSRMRKPDLGQFKATGTAPRRKVAEIRVLAGQLAEFPVGSQVPASVFAEGALVDVTGTSIGKGFQGVVKKHHMAGQTQTHGTHEEFRHGGSIGCRKTPGRVFPGKRMSGRMGGERLTIQNLKVARVLADDHVLLVRGAVPGSANGYVTVRMAVKPAVRAAHQAAKKTKKA